MASPTGLASMVGLCRRKLLREMGIASISCGPLSIAVDFFFLDICSFVSSYRDLLSRIVRTASWIPYLNQEKGIL